MPDNSEWEPVATESEWQPVPSSGEWDAVTATAAATTPAPSGGTGPTIQELRAGGILAPLTEKTAAAPHDQTKVPLRTTIGGEPQPAFTYDTTPEERQEKFSREIVAPIVPIPKFTVNPDDSKTVAVGKSIVNFLSGVVEFAESPAGILTAPVAGMAPKAVATFFTYDMAKSLGEQATAAGMDWDVMTDAQKAAAVTDMTATGLLATALGSGVGVKVAMEARVGLETAQKFSDTKAPITPDFDVAAFNELNKVAPLTAAETIKTAEATAEPLPSSAKPPGTATAAEPSANTPVSEGQVPPSPVIPTAKEPWEMTKQEGDKWVDENMINAVKADNGRIVARNMEHGDMFPMLEESGSTFKNPNARGWALIGKKPSESYIGIQDVQAAKGDFHKAYVMKAIREGKEVPAEVIADYTDLQKPVKLGGAESDLPTQQREKSRRNNEAQAAQMRAELAAMGVMVPEKAAMKPEKGLPESATESDLMADMTEAGRTAFREAKAKPDEFAAVDVTDLSAADRRNLARLGLSFSEDRQRRIMAVYPARFRTEDFRKAVQARQAAVQKPVRAENAQTEPTKLVAIDASKSVKTESPVAGQISIEGKPSAVAIPPPRSTEIKPGDAIRWEPNERERRYQGPVDGIVVDVISNTEGEFGYHILAPLEGDPGRVVRVWANRGKVVSRKPSKVVERTGTAAVQAGRLGEAGTTSRPKPVTEIADEIAARGIDPQASYGEFVKARDLKPEISAKEWLPIYRQSLELAKYPKPTSSTPPSKPAEVSGSEGETAGAIATPGAPLGPAASGQVSLPPKSQRQIITDIAKGLNLPVRFGRLTTTKFGGYFKRIENLIGSKRADDIPVVSHEAGHKLDATFKLSDDASLRSELDVLGDPATPGSRSSWTKSKTRKYKMGEGVAEFVRHWLTDPAHAQKVAPNTFTAFERGLDANKDFGDTMRQAQQDIAVWRNSEPQARLRSQISVGENPNKTPYTASQLTRDLVDDLHILRLATLDAAPKGSSLAPSLDPYLLARNLRGSYGMAATFIRDGVVDFKSKEVKLGTGLEDALKPVAGRLNDFRDWIVAKRAQELRAQGRESGLVSSDVDAVAKKFDADPDFQKAFQSVKEWNDSLLQYAVDSGLIIKGTPRTPKEGPTGSYAIREMNQNYVPFHRVFEIGAGESPSQQASGIGMGLNVGKPGSLKGLKGSPRQIVDPFETMVKNAYTIITASEKAAINLAVADMSKLPDMGKWVERIAAPKERVQVELDKIRQELEAAGADLTNVPDDLLLSFFRQSRGAPFGENIIRINRDGKSEFYRLNQDLHDTFKALDLEDTGKLVRMLSAPAQLLRAGVVLEPSFNVANVLRDTFSAAVIGKYGAFPFETTFRGVASMANNPKLVAEWAAAGGKSAVEASYFDRVKLQKFLHERIAKDLTPAERALIVTKSPLSALRWLSSTFEEATRIGEYQIALNKLTKSGMPIGEARRQAAFEARDRQDFAKGGAKTKIIRHMAAFWNAALQANVKLLQAFKERPVRTTLQGLAFITIPKLIEQAINWDDEDYWARKQWERDLFFLIPIGKDESGHTRFLRIPTPFEVGVIFGTLPGRMLQSMRDKDAEAMKGFPSLMLKQSIPNPVPQAYQVVFEDFLSGKQGWDVWRGRTIVPDSLADEPPELQWTEQTSGIAKKAGQVLKFSPMKIDHLIERTTGGMGKVLTGRSVPGQRFVTAPLTVSNQATETFYERLTQLREDAGRAKAANEDPPAALKDFESAARELSSLRREIRAETDKAIKAQLQQQMLEIATEVLAQNPK